MPDLNRTAMVSAFERELGCRLPAAYAAFLLSHSDQLLQPAVEYPLPAGSLYGSVGVADVLLRIEDLAENSRNKVVGLPDQHMMHIGHSLLSPNLYMCFSDAEFGAVYAGDPLKTHRLVPVASSFEGFLSICRPAADAEA